MTDGWCGWRLATGVRYYYGKMARAEVNRLSGIIDGIYAAALDGTEWPRVIEGLCTAFRSHAAGVYTADFSDCTVDVLGMRGIDDGQVRVYVERHLRDNPWSRAPKLQGEGVLRTDRSLDEHYRRPGYYRRTALFNEWMKPQDFIHTLGVNVLCEPPRQVKAFVYRAACEGAFEAREIAVFRRINSHLRNAVTVARRLELLGTRLDAAQHVLDRIPVGVMFLDRTGRVVQANRRAAQMFEADGILRLRDGAVVARHPHEERRLARAIRAALDSGEDAATIPAAIELSRPGRRPLSFVAVPLARSGDGRWFSAQLAAALIITDPESATVLCEDWLRRRFGLTAREAALSGGLARGLTLRAAADANHVSYETARWYLKQVFQKTGVARQSELIALLLSERILGSFVEPDISPPPPRLP